MLPQVKVKGQASNRTYTIECSQQDLEKKLMFFLQENNLPIASSCSGKNVCRKCVINNDVLSCQISLQDWLKQRKNEEIKVGYL